MNLILLLAGLLFLIPGIIQIRNYSLVKSNSYLIFSLLFFLSMFDQVLVAIDSSLLFSEVLISIVYVLIHLIIIQLSSEYINHKLPINIRKLFLYGLTTALALIILKSLIYYNLISSDRENLKFVIGEPLRIITGYMLVYSFRNSKLLQKTNRTSIISFFWMVAGYTMLLSGIIRFSIYSYEVGSDVFTRGVLTQSWLDLAIISGDLNSILLAFIATIVALFYPESMLLTHVQVLKAAKIYQISQGMAKTEEIDKVEERGLFKNLSSESLLDYISQLPDEIIDKLDLEK